MKPHEVLAQIAEAKADGLWPACTQCKSYADVALFCDTGDFHAVACEACWGVHEERLEAMRIFQVSGMAPGIHCSRCNTDNPSDNHIQVVRL